jgi:hypothetical protein
MIPCIRPLEGGGYAMGMEGSIDSVFSSKDGSDTYAMGAVYVDVSNSSIIID